MATKTNKVDLYKQHKHEYGAAKKPRIVDVGSASYLAIEGTGAPGGEEFQETVGALYAAAYTIKMISKAAGRDYVICKLEAIWWTDGDGDLESTPQDQWRWKMLIRTPDFIRKKNLADAAKKIAAKGKVAAIDRVVLEKLREGKCVQALHVGPYDKEPETIALMQAFAESQGLHLRGRHHEIYLSDPRRIEPERLKTIVRRAVA